MPSNSEKRLQQQRDHLLAASAAVGIVNIALAQGLLLLLVYLWSNDEPQQAHLAWQERSARGDGESGSREEEIERETCNRHNTRGK